MLTDPYLTGHVTDEAGGSVPRLAYLGIIPACRVGLYVAQCAQHRPRLRELTL
jgi:hypothetical protein